MKELKCPKCGSVFSVDEADYAFILQQVKTAEFDCEIERRIAEVRKQDEANAELAIARLEAKSTAALEKKKRERDAAQQAQTAPAAGGQPIPCMPQAGAIQDLGLKPEVPTGQGYGNLQRVINKTGDTKGLV
jgi:hypothetical protein